LNVFIFLIQMCQELIGQNLE